MIKYYHNKIYIQKNNYYILMIGIAWSQLRFEVSNNSLAFYFHVTAFTFLQYQKQECPFSDIPAFFRFHCISMEELQCVHKTCHACGTHA